jgi:hypothetical protein
MTLTTSASLLALGFLVQSSPPTGAAGSAGAAGSGGVKAGDATSGATMTNQGKKPGHDLADILLPLAGSQRRSGSFGPPSPPALGDLRVNSRSGASQSQPQIACDPTDRRHLVATAVDLRNDGNPGSDCNAAFYASFDGGATWSEFLDTHPIGYAATASAVAFGPAGETYLCTHLGVGPYRWLRFGRSLDGGLTEPNWDDFGDLGSGGSEPSIAVDATHGGNSGRIYVAYGHFHADEESHFWIGVATSADGGKSFDDKVVNDDLADTVFSPSAVVDSKGVVHVVFFDWSDGTLLADASSDGGATWGTDVAIANAQDSAVPGLSGSFHPRPRLAVDSSGGPFHDTLYVTWAQKGGSDGPDVVFSTSTDGGATWSAPRPASDATSNSQISPDVTVDPQGGVHFGFQDCRDDPGNRRVNTYASSSSDGGATLLPNVRLSAADFDPTTYGRGREVVLGSGIAASDREVHATWTDGRNGNNDVFTAPANLDLFTDVATISAATGGTATFTVSPGPLFGSTEYHVLGSLSGTTPGTDFFFENVPINYDLFTLATIYDANSNVFPGFTGALDASGAAAAQLVSGPLPPALIGVQMDFAALVRVNGAVRWGSAPTSVVIGN